MKTFISRLIVPWIGCVGLTLSTLATADVYTIAKNGYEGASIWVTLYGADKFAGSIRWIADYGCVKAGETRKFRIVSNSGGENAYLRSELKQNVDCVGNTLHDTIVNSGADAGGNINYTLLPQADYPQTYWAKGLFPVASPTIPELPPAVETRIFSRTNYNGLSMVLGIDATDPNCAQKIDGLCKAVLRTYRYDDDGQIWNRITLKGAHVFVNKANGMIAQVRPGQGNPIVLFTSTTTNTYIGRWTIGGNCNSGCALRPIHDDGQNLNVFGGGPHPEGSAVGTWGWGGGSLNETWILSPAP